jgi:serine/threonine-protein kinase SRPK3
MFSARGANNEQSSLYHLAEMVAILGPPPKDFLQQSETASQYFDKDGQSSYKWDHIWVDRNAVIGKWKGNAKIPAMSLEESEENLSGENKALFLQFMRKMLQWKPENRYSCKELLQDPWLKGEF